MNENVPKNKKPNILNKHIGFLTERRVRDSNPRTLLQVNGFQDHRNRPLCQLSGANIRIDFFLQKRA